MVTNVQKDQRGKPNPSKKESSRLHILYLEKAEWGLLFFSPLQRFLLNLPVNLKPRWPISMPLLKHSA